MTTVDPADERRHDPDDSELWNESYYLDWFADDGSMGGYVRVGFVPNIGQVWYWACFVEADGPLITVIDHEVPAPADPRSLALRHDGLWADHTVAEPLERMSCDLEAFAVSLDDPAEVYRGGWGDRIPFGFELDWHTDRAAYQWPPLTTPRYEIPCRVEGHVLVGDRRIEVDGWGQRDHSWGAARDWWGNQWCWTAGRLEDGTRWHTAGAFHDGLDLGVAYVLEPGSTQFIEANDVAVRSEHDADGLATQVQLTFGPLDLEITPIAWSPVLLTHPDGREARFPRAMGSVRAADGRTGLCWFEFNQPPPA